MSVNVGQTINFKIKTPASSYHIDILRLGYYGGDGARIIASDIQPTATSRRRSRPADESSTGLVDCGNWGVSAPGPSRATPSRASTSHTWCATTPAARARSSSSCAKTAATPNIVLKTSTRPGRPTTTTAATASTPARSPARPGTRAATRPPTRSPTTARSTAPWNGQRQSDPFYAEYQLIRFLERNGYDMSYVSQARPRRERLAAPEPQGRSSRAATTSTGPRANAQSVESARSAGVNLAFFSGNEIFWKTRWANSSEGRTRPIAPLITYKDTHFAPGRPLGRRVTTPTWRDPRFSPPGDAGRPENSVTRPGLPGQLGNLGIKVPATFAKLRFWRNTAVSTLTSGQTLTLAPGTGTLGLRVGRRPR